MLHSLQSNTPAVLAATPFLALKPRALRLWEAEQAGAIAALANPRGDSLSSTEAAAEA